MSQNDHTEGAEMQFYDAFERLKRGRPMKLPLGAPISQNNVAKEAGRDPSALRKSRYPGLVRTIQKWIEDNGTRPNKKASGASLLKGARDKNRELKVRIQELAQQRDRAMARLVIAEEAVLDLHRKLRDCQARAGDEGRTVVPFGVPGRRVKQPSRS